MGIPTSPILIFNAMMIDLRAKHRLKISSSLDQDELGLGNKGYFSTDQLKICTVLVSFNKKLL